MVFGAFCPNPVFHAHAEDGTFLVGGLINFYEAGTSDTRKKIWSDATLTTERDNPITLNARGEPEDGAGIFGDGLYKVILTTDLGVTIWTLDYLPLWGIKSIIQQILAANTAIEIINILGINNHEHNTDFQPTESQNGSRTGFSTLKKFISGTLHVYENGVLLLNGSDFTEDADKRGYNFNGFAPRADSIIQHRYLVDLTA